MAKQGKQERLPDFSLNDKELAAKIEEYKEGTANERWPRPSWPHFCAFIDSTEKEVAYLIRYGDRTDIEANAYTRRSRELKKMLTWMRGQLLSGKGWSGQNQTKAIFSLKQDMGDGYSYSDQPVNSGPAEIKVVFGGSDARAKRAAK